MSSGAVNLAVAKGTKAKLERVDAFRNDQDGNPGDPRPYPDTETWRAGIGEKLKYRASELRKNLEVCFVPSRYDG